MEPTLVAAAVNDAERVEHVWVLFVLGYTIDQVLEELKRRQANR